jgi:DNA mismatch repair protein MutL
MAIIRLSESTINLIAAGEVVERPASVVKELVENSIDAGAKSIEIYLEQAGKNLIVVSDDGYGMSADDMLLAIERHTTSKLDESDILNIRSFGFRGEALPSISSVSKLSIISKIAANPLAFKLCDNATIAEVVHQCGTKIEVKDLFYSVPARLKFLKSDTTELSSCLEAVKKLALTSPQISFTLKHQERTLLKVEKTDDIKVRIKDILGDDFSRNSIEIELSNDFLKVYGYVSLPTYHRASSDEQFVFVNSRPVKDKLISGSIKAAYQDYIVSGRFAPLVLFIEVPYNFVDVNVHPAKNEVRFQDTAKVRNGIVHAIKNSINSEKSGVSTTFVDQAIGYFSSAKNTPSNSSLSEHEARYKPQIQTTNWQNIKSSITPIQSQLDLDIIPQTYVASVFEHANEHKPEESSKLQNFELGSACAQLHNNYIVAQTQNGIVIVDQHAAHERIVYEQLKKQLTIEPLIGQKLLLPILVELSNSSKAEVLIANKAHLASLALVIESFSDTKIIVHEVPGILIKDDITKLICDIADELCETEQEFSLSKLIEHVIETYACHHSVRSGQKLSISEMNDLLRQIEATPAAGQCCHGRPTYMHLTLNELEKLFCRK